MSGANTPPYTEYVPADPPWLGRIPKGWRVLRGKYSFHEHSERSDTGNELLLSVSEYFGVKPRQDTVDAGEHLSRAESLVGYKKCAVNDLVMNIMLAWKKGLGVSKYEGIVSPAYSVFRFMRHVNPDYMHYLLRTDLYSDYFKARSTGIMDSRLRLYPDSFRDVALLLPTKGEQTQIAKFLDYETARIDALIEKQQQLIALLKEKRQAVISHAVTKGLNPDAPMRNSGVEWIGEVPAHWEVSRLKYAARVVDCRNKTPEYFDDGEYFVIRTTNVKEQQLRLDESTLRTDQRNFDIWTQRGIPPAGSILFTREAPAGEVCLVPAEAKLCMGQRMMNFIPYNESQVDYLFSYLLSDCLTRYIGSVSLGSTVSHLRVDQVENIPVPVPPDEEARGISKEVTSLREKMGKLIGIAVRKINVLQERRIALISAAVTGKIDVRGWQPPSELENASTTTSETDSIELPA